MPQTRKEMENIWELVASYRSMDRDGLIESIANHLEFLSLITHLTLPTKA